MLYFILASWGITQVLVYSKIFDVIRPKYYFFHCPMCVGFWVGISLMLLSPFTELFTYDVSLANGLILGSMSSAASYALCMIISDGGVQYEYRIKGGMDTKVDAQTRNQLLQG
tara:strand:- start:1180 stop:1518 length:339 start_codon:yes stop_codon:yes gene_type:complete